MAKGGMCGKGGVHGKGGGTCMVGDMVGACVVGACMAGGLVWQGGRMHGRVGHA